MPADLPFAPSLADGRRLLHLPGQGAAGGRRLPGARWRGAGDGQAAVRARPRAGRARRRPRRRRPARGDPRRSPQAAQELGLPVRGFASSGLPGPKGNRETFVWCGGEGPGVEDLEAAVDRGRGGRVKTAALITHSHPPAATEAVAIAARVAAEAGWRLVGDRGGAGTSTATPAEGVERHRRTSTLPDLCLVLGGDGSILHALRRFARTGVPVFGVNFGTVGFLAAVERDEAEPRGSAAPSRARSRRSSCPASRSRSTASRGSASTTSPSPAAPTTGSPSSATGSPARRSATSAATGSSPRPRSARPATTSPTRARSSPGA